MIHYIYYETKYHNIAHDTLLIKIQQFFIIILILLKREQQMDNVLSYKNLNQAVSYVGEDKKFSIPNSLYSHVH